MVCPHPCESAGPWDYFRARKNGCGVQMGAAFLRIREEIMKKRTKLALSLVALLVVAALFGGLYWFTRPQPVEGLKAVEVVVVHADQSEKTFSYETTEIYLGTLLLNEGLIKGEDGSYGLYIKEVDGEVADYDVNGAYWALFKGETYATTGIDTTVMEDGDQFSLVYTLG